MKFDLRALEHFPTEPGVYLMKNDVRTVIYIGKAKNLRQRLKQYFSPSGDTRPMIPFLIQQVAHIDTIIVLTEKEALLLENTLIKKHQPKFNALLKDDKTFIHLMINIQHEWPMLRLVRYKGAPEKNHLYFGPYTSAFAARQVHELLSRIFPLRQCSDEELKRRTKPCLLYAIKRCIAPCVGKCSKKEYDIQVEGTIQFLKGEDQKIIKELRKEMELASDRLEFEKAGHLLQTIHQIEHVTRTHPLVIKADGTNTDVLSLYREAEEVTLVQLIFREGMLIGSEHYHFSNILEEDEALFSSFILQHYSRLKQLPQEIFLPIPLSHAQLLTEILSDLSQQTLSISFPQKGPKKELLILAEKNAKAIFAQEKNHQDLKEKVLLDLQEILKLNRYPKEIECLDTSNLSGTDPVASIITFSNGLKNPKKTRLFKIKSSQRSDDYSAMKEVLRRHLTRGKKEDTLPDLLILDGGKGQLGVGLEIFKELDIAFVDLIALTKEKARHDKGLTQETIFLPGHHDPIHLNQRSNILFFLQQIRDEAHRKAISFHRQKRKHRTIASALDIVPGIGKTKRLRLLKHFGSVQRVREASDEALLAVPGITKKDVKAIRELAKPS